MSVLLWAIVQLRSIILDLIASWPAFVYVPEIRVPPSSYAQAVDRANSGAGAPGDYNSLYPADKQFCQYALVGTCPIGDECEYFHGHLCEICNCQVLDPDDHAQRAEHEKVNHAGYGAVTAI